LAVVAAGTLLGACSDDITVPNYNNPTVEGLSADPARLQLLANGVAYQLGLQSPGYIDDLGTLGRESYEYTPTEGRNLTAYVQAQRIDRAGFAGVSLWTGRYTNLRNLFNLREAVDATSTISPAQKAAANGYAKTMEALELHYVIATRDTIGAPVELTGDLTYVAPFVSRDSVYRYISARLDEGAADLQTGAAATLPFSTGLQFTGLGTVTPATILRFNRALAARVFAYRGSMGLNCGTSCYAQALTALQGSFLAANASTRAAFDAGVYNVYGTGTGVTQNTLSRLTSAGALRYAHPSILRDTTGRDANGRAVYSTTENAERRADARITSKVTTASGGNPPAAIAASAISTPYGFNLYSTASSAIPIIRNEELILLRAEANIGTGNLAGALADINTVRTGSGGIPALATLGTAAQAIDVLLEERHRSLLFEGHRIIDARRLNRLSAIPLDKVATSAESTRHFVNSVLPVPQAECLSRALTPELQPLSCRQ
jgi:hypothetical protein